jgi:hypothetical protein
MIVEPSWTANNFVERKMSNELRKMASGNYGLHWNRSSSAMFFPEKYRHGC